MATASTSSDLSPWVLGLSVSAVLVFAAGALAGLSGSVALFEAMAHGADGPSTKHLVLLRGRDARRVHPDRVRTAAAADVIRRFTTSCTPQP